MYLLPHAIAMYGGADGVSHSVKVSTSRQAERGRDWGLGGGGETLQRHQTSQGRPGMTR